MTRQQPKSLLNFYRTGPMPCPYRAGQIERNLFTELTGPYGSIDSIELHDQLTKAGFRRSHTVVYRPACPTCNACVPVRVPVARFVPSRSQQRTIARNADLTVTFVRAEPTNEQFRLFTRYQRHRHAGGDMAAMSFTDYAAMIEDTLGQTRLAEFRDSDDRLIGVCLTDFLRDALSAVYSFFEPDEDVRSLGNYMVLSLIDYAARQDLRHVYLGYWIADSQKMSYKTRFRPLEALRSDGWGELGATDE